MDALRQRRIPLLGLVFNGEPVESSRQAILESTGLKVLLDLERAVHIDSTWVEKQAAGLQL